MHWWQLAQPVSPCQKLSLLSLNQSERPDLDPFRGRSVLRFTVKRRMWQESQGNLKLSQHSLLIGYTPVQNKKSKEKQEGDGSVQADKDGKRPYCKNFTDRLSSSCRPKARNHDLNISRYLGSVVPGTEQALSKF